MVRSGSPAPSRDGSDAACPGWQRRKRAASHCKATTMQHREEEGEPKTSCTKPSIVTGLAMPRRHSQTRMMASLSPLFSQRCCSCGRWLHCPTACAEPGWRAAALTGAREGRSQCEEEPDPSPHRDCPRDLLVATGHAPGKPGCAGTPLGFWERHTATGL